MAFLTLAIHTFETYKSLGERAMAQVPDDTLTWTPGEDVNSIAVIVHHLSGNMLSRWTDFLTSDGEKEWRKRDEEFEDQLHSRDEIMARWEEGWSCLFKTLKSLTDEDMARTVKIRSEPHTVEKAIIRQLSHYAYHVGQLVYVARIIQGKKWQSLSIPKGQSDVFNQEKMGA